MIALLTLIACLDPIQKDTDTASGDSDDSGAGGGSSIFDVRSGAIGDGETVTLTGVLVSSPVTRVDDDSGRSDGFFIQDPAGGEKSGLYVWSQGQFGDELTVVVGDKVSISGQISEFYDWTELVVGDASSITRTGSGTLPAPAALGDGAGVDWDAYESVPVTLTEQTVESVNAFNTGTLTAGVSLDDGFVYNDYGCRGHYATVTGIVFFRNYDDEVTPDDWSLNNRSEADLGAYTEGAVIDTTIHAIRMGEVCGPVRVQGVVSTAASYGESKEETSIFVQDVGGGEYSSLLAFSPSEHVAYDAGTTFDITGDVSNYYGLIELFVGDIAGISATGTAEPVVDVLVDAPADWLPWQSALVTITNVTTTSDQDDFGVINTDKGVYLDDLLSYFEATNGQTWSSVTGPIFYTSYDDEVKFLLEPRSAADFVE